MEKSRYQADSGLLALEPITSLTPHLQSDSILVSSLDSTLRLMDKSDGKLLQSYRHADYINSTYRIRSTLGAHDSIAVSGSEDGWIYAWDVLSGQLVDRVRHNEQQLQGTKNSKKVVSALAYKKREKEWASAGGDGTSMRRFVYSCKHILIRCEHTRYRRCLGLA